jgi:hypothetical protein
MELPPPTTPATTETAPASNQPDDEEKDNRADGGVNDRADRSAPKMDAQAGQQPVTDGRADDPDDYIPDQAITGSAHDLPGQPPGDQADQHYDNNAFIRQMHDGHLHVAPDCALGAHNRAYYLIADRLDYASRILRRGARLGARTGSPAVAGLCLYDFSAIRFTMSQRAQLQLQP